MGSKAQNRKLRDANRQRMKDARMVEECFSTEAGKHVWAMIMPYYEQPIEPTNVRGESVYRNGQRSVVGMLYEHRKMVRAGIPGRQPGGEDVTSEEAGDEA